MFSIVIRFVVSVPVLSVQRISVDPKLSVAENLLHTMLFLAKFIIEKHRMHVSSRFKIPGALATITPIAISAAIIAGNPTPHPPKNVKAPIQRAKIVILMTKLESSSSK